MQRSASFNHRTCGPAGATWRAFSPFRGLRSAPVFRHRPKVRRRRNRWPKVSQTDISQSGNVSKRRETFPQYLAPTTTDHGQLTNDQQSNKTKRRGTFCLSRHRPSRVPWSHRPTAPLTIPMVRMGTGWNIFSIVRRKGTPLPRAVKWLTRRATLRPVPSAAGLSHLAGRCQLHHPSYGYER